MIMQLQQDEGVITGEEELQNYVSSYYKGLFGPAEENFVNLDESQTQDILKISYLGNENLVQPFSEQEVKDAVF